MRALLVFLLVLGASAGAAAQEPASIAWGELACEAPMPLEERVRSLLPARSPVPDAFHARASITPQPGGFRLGVELPGGAHRELVSSDCDALVEAAALIVAVAIDPAAMSTPDPEQRPDAPEPTLLLGRALEPPAQTASTEPAEPAEPGRARLGVGVHVAVAAGVLPDPLPGPALELMAGYDALVVRAGLLYLPASRAPYDATRGASIELVTARVALCGRLELPPLSGELCADAEAGDLRAAGYGLDSPRASDNAWGSLGTSLRMRVALVGPLGVSAMIGASFAIDPPTFFIEGLGDLFTPSEVSLRALLGLDLELFP